ncbi:hypothetical protein N0B44_21225 [Roseibacterium beibuensis]|uniref:hypothetical protein n=1 Tax=[Roseibacterium] beibuensis TaxID=1193142 RepID=UPI00217DEF31|nr:hypothetical protein [Roseibacterium beibuensis]MCS6625438.1 hypothetical protein [Roseibacterium beibuensis]
MAAAFYILALSAALFGQDQPFAATPMGYVQTLSGACGPDSRVAEGSADSDLSTRRSRFFCNSAVISFTRITDGRVMIQFSERERQSTSILGFAGQAIGGDLIQVDAVYLGAEVLVPQEGMCKLFYDDSFQVTGASCGARIEGGGRVTVPIVSFETPKRPT